MSRNPVPSLFLFLVLCFVSAHGMIRVFNGLDTTSKLAYKADLKYWSAMFSKNDTPAGDMDPYVSAEFTLKRDNTTASGFVTVLVYEVTALKTIGVPINGSEDMEYCCTKKLFKQGYCQHSTPGHVTRRPDPSVHEDLALFEQGNDTATISFHGLVERTGIYYVHFFNCEDNNVGNVILTGTAVWLNPFGYLPGNIYGKLPFGGVLTLLYILVFLSFSVLCIKYRKILMTLQWEILAVIGFSALESAAWYFYRLGTNNNGYYSIAGLLFVVFMANVKRTVARVLVLLVSMGLGIVKWTLGTARVKIGLLAAFSMFFSFLFQTISEIEDLAERDVISQWVTLFVIVPAAILDTGFYYWIILSLIRTMQQLTLRHQVLKLAMYKRFFGVLIVSGVLSALAVIYQFYLKAFQAPYPWRLEWLKDGFWDVLFFCILTAVAFLWRPRSNNTRYGYGEFFQDDDDVPDDAAFDQVPLETVNVATGGSLRKRAKSNAGSTPKPKDDYESDREKNIERTKMKYSDFDKDVLSIDLPDDEESDIGLETQLKKMD